MSVLEQSSESQFVEPYVDSPIATLEACPSAISVQSTDTDPQKLRLYAVPDIDQNPGIYEEVVFCEELNRFVAPFATPNDMYDPDERPQVSRHVRIGHPELPDPADFLTPRSKKAGNYAGARALLAAFYAAQ